MTLDVRLIVGPKQRVRSALEWCEGGGTVLVPDAAMAHRFGQLLASCDKPTDVSVYPYYVWFDKQWEYLGDGRRLADDATRRAVLAECITARRMSRGSRPADVGDLPGGIRFFARLAQLIDESEISRLPESDPVATILNSYSRLLRERGLVELHWAEKAIAESDGWGNGLRIAYVGSGLLKSSAAHVLAGASSMGDIAVFLAPLGCDLGDLYGPYAEAMPSGAAYYTCVPRGEQSDLSCAQDALGGGVLQDEWRSDESVRVVRTSDSTGIAEAVASVVAQRIADGVEPEQIAVLFSKYETTGAAISAALTKRDIPSIAVGRHRFQHAGLGRAFVAGARVALSVSTQSDELGGSGLGALLRSAYSGVEPLWAAQVDALARKHGMSARALLYKLSASDEEIALIPAEMNSVARRLRQCAFGSEESKGSAVAARDWKLLLDDMLASAEQARWSGGAHAPWAEQQDRAAHLGITEVIASLDPTGAGIRPEQLLEQLLAGEYAVREPMLNAGRVLVRPLEAVRADWREHVIIAGVRRGGSAGAEPDAAVASTLGRWRVPHLGTPREADRYALLLAALTAEQSLTVIASANPADHVPTEPDLADALLEASGGRCLVEEAGTSADKPSPVINLDPARGGSIDIPDEYWSSHPEFSPSAIERYYQCPYGWFLGRFVGGDELDTELGGREMGSAVHEVLRRFYERLRMERPEGRVTTENIDDALGIYEDVVRDALGGGLMELDRSWAQASPLEVHGLAVALQEARGRIIADAELLISGSKRELTYVPTHFELRFGSMAPVGTGGGAIEEPTLPSVTVEGVPLRGSIDRVDTAEDSSGQLYAVAIDYKKSLNNAGLQQTFLSNKRIQVLIYALAAEQILGAKPAGGLLSSYQKAWETKGAIDTELAKVKPRGGPSAKAMTLGEILDETRLVVSECASAMNKGRIAPVEPGSADAKHAGCQFCGYYRCPSRDAGGAW